MCFAWVHAPPGCASSSAATVAVNLVLLGLIVGCYHALIGTLWETAINATWRGIGAEL